MLDILYRDDHLIAINKPAGYLVHPADEPQPDDLVAMKILRDQIGQHVFNVHRLDRPTCGVLLFALDSATAKIVHRAFAKHKVQKSYLAVVCGHPELDQWTEKSPLDKGGRTQEAETHFKVLQRLPEELSLVEARPVTGRYHQIRRHLLAHGHPIIGDYRYLDTQICDGLGARLGTGTRMLLQAKSLELSHPVASEKLVISAPLDPLLAQITQ